MQTRALFRLCECFKAHFGLYSPRLLFEAQPLPKSSRASLVQRHPTTKNRKQCRDTFAILFITFRSQAIEIRLIMTDEKIWKERDLTLLYDMVSKISVISSGWLTLWTTGWEVVVESRSITGCRSSVKNWFVYGENRAQKLHKRVVTTRMFKLSWRAYVQRKLMNHGAYHVPLGFNMINALVLNVTGKAFVQPEVVPPFHRYEVSEPLWETGT